MADSKNKKPSQAKSSTPSTASKKVVDKATTVKADNATKTNNTNTTAAKATPTKAAATSVASKSVTDKTIDSKKDGNQTVSKATETKKVSPTKPVQKEKRPGSGMAFLALVCSLGALGLSGYMFYEQQLSPQTGQTQDALLSGVNEIKTNVTEFGDVVSGLQQDVIDFKEKQSQYITKDTLESVVKTGVDNAVADLPDLPSIGPDSLSSSGQQASSIEQPANTLTEGSVLNDGSLPSDGSLSAEGSSIAKGSSSSGEESSAPSVNNSTDGSSAESETAENAQQDEDTSAWSFGRAKQDLKDMVLGFVSIKKTDQDKN